MKLKIIKKNIRIIRHYYFEDLFKEKNINNTFLFFNIDLKENIFVAFYHQSIFSLQ